MTTLVVPLDGSEFAERGLPVATRLATRLDGDVLAVTSKWDDDMGAPAKYLDDVIARTGVKTVLARDQDAVGAIEYAAHDGPDRTVCMTTHGRGGLRWAMLGSVAEEVLHRLPEPVVLVGRHCDAQRVDGDELVVCYDGSDAASAVVAASATWAKALDLAVHLVYVAHPLDLETSQHPESIFGDAAAKLEARGLSPQLHVLHGNYVPGMLADFAGSRAAALIAIASRRRTGLARFALGSTTMGVVGSAPCPVVVAHPAH
jgi:nucleotide-binding universal stress UspA family protein